MAPRFTRITREQKKILYIVSYIETSENLFFFFFLRVFHYFPLVKNNSCPEFREHPEGKGSASVANYYGKTSFSSLPRNTARYNEWQSSAPSITVLNDVLIVPFVASPTAGSDFFLVAGSNLLCRNLVTE